MTENWNQLDADDHVALRAVSAQYAAGADQRDSQMFAGAFLPDGVLETYLPGGTGNPSRRYQGQAELEAIPQNLTKYAETFHFLGQSTFTTVEGEATGDVYCIAHHLTKDIDGDTDRVMYIRYHDRYAKLDGQWRIAVRGVHTDWIDHQAVTLPEG